MLHLLQRETRAAEHSDWPAPPLPTARVSRRIGATLISLALMGLAALVVSFLAG